MDFFLGSKVSVAVDRHFTCLENKTTCRFRELISTLFLERSPQECRSPHSLQKQMRSYSCAGDDSSSVDRGIKIDFGSAALFQQ